MGKDQENEKKGDEVEKAKEKEKFKENEKDKDKENDKEKQKEEKGSFICAICTKKTYQYLLLQLLQQQTQMQDVHSQRFFRHYLVISHRKNFGEEISKDDFGEKIRGK